MPLPLVLASIAGSVGSALIQSGAAKRAAKRQAQAAEDAVARRRALTERAVGSENAFLNRSLDFLDPQIGAGATSRMALLDLLGLNGATAANTALAEFQASPSFKFRRDQGAEAVDRSAAARGLLRSGGTLKALAQFGQNLAANEFDARANRLFNFVQSGDIAARTGAQLTQNTGGRITNALLGLGGAESAAIQNAAAIGARGTLGSAQAIGSNVNNLLALAAKNPKAFGLK